jgi:hypothetical protein
VACHYHDAVDDLRKQEVRRLKHELPAEAVNDLKHTLWPFCKRSTELEAAERARVDTLLAYCGALRMAYDLREQLTTIFDTARSKADGLRRLAGRKERSEALRWLMEVAGHLAGSECERPSSVIKPAALSKG